MKRRGMTLLTVLTLVCALCATGAAGALVGRGALGKPWFFAQLNAAHAGQPIPPDPSAGQRAQLMLDHARLAIEDKGETLAMRELRKVLGHYVKGLPGAVRFRGGAAGRGCLTGGCGGGSEWQTQRRTGRAGRGGPPPGGGGGGEGGPLFQ